MKYTDKISDALCDARDVLNALKMNALDEIPKDNDGTCTSVGDCLENIISFLECLPSKKLSEIYKDLGIAFTFPIEIKDSDGKVTYHETSDGFWYRYEYDANGNETYYELSNGFWCKYEYDSNGNEAFYEKSDGYWHKREYDSDGDVSYHEDSTGEKIGKPNNKTQ